MYRAVILYFSGTGNTWWVADAIRKQLDAKDINADAVSVDSLTPKKAGWWIKTADLVIFGWPIYGSDMPEPMKRFIDTLPVVEKGKHVHVFCTQSAFSGDGAWQYHRHFKDKGLFIDSAEHFIMPNNKSRSGSDPHYSAVMERCGISVERYVERLLLGRARIRGKCSRALGALQRGPFRLLFRRWRDLMGVDESRCTRCGLCETYCPMGNIKLGEKVEFLGRCALCMRCRAICPVAAVTFRGKTGVPYTLKDKRFKPAIFK